ncbi:MAG: hypothetical protein CMJ18_11285 [Phycisphaeraceae bacterium]|nr:hypothetical protein [Phycisphaeraceae bacterium]
MTTKSILVFGATGEIGGRIARQCVDAGHRVTGVTRGANQRPSPDLSGVELLQADKGERECYTGTLAGRAFDVVIDSVPAAEHVTLAFEHFAGSIQHYLMCGSTGTFAPLQYLPADENHPWREKTEVNFYHQSVRDAAALDLHARHGFPVAILRPTNIIGPDRVPLELWGGRSPKYFRRMLAHEAVEIPVCGNILVQSGYNDDLASAFVSAASKGPEIDGEIFVISTRKAITLDRYAEVARDVLSSRSRVEVLPIEEIRQRYPDDVNAAGIRFLVEHMCFDLRKAERMLDYDPKFTAEQGLEQALKWCLDEGMFES